MGHIVILVVVLVMIYIAGGSYSHTSGVHQLQGITPFSCQRIVCAQERDGNKVNS